MKVAATMMAVGRVTHVGKQKGMRGVRSISSMAVDVQEWWTEISINV